MDVLDSLQKPAFFIAHIIFNISIIMGKISGLSNKFPRLSTLLTARFLVKVPGEAGTSLAHVTANAHLF
jgi:hypothetical protein